MEIITLSEVEISYYGGGDDKSKHENRPVFTSESLQLRVMLCCDLPEMKCKRRKEQKKKAAHPLLSSQLEERLGGMFSFEKSAEKRQKVSFSSSVPIKVFP